MKWMLSFREGGYSGQLRLQQKKPGSRKSFSFVLGDARALCVVERRLRTDLGAAMRSDK